MSRAASIRSKIRVALAVAGPLTIQTPTPAARLRSSPTIPRRKVSPARIRVKTIMKPLQLGRVHLSAVLPVGWIVPVGTRWHRSALGSGPALEVTDFRGCRQAGRDDCLDGFLRGPVQL